MICTKSCNLLLDDLAQSIFYLEWRTFGLDLDFDFGGFCLRLLDCHVISELVQAEGIEPPILQRASGLQPDERHRSRPANWRSAGESNVHPEGATVFKTACLTIDSALQKLTSRLLRDTLSALPEQIGLGKPCHIPTLW